MEWTKYTTKEALKDNDELMILDKDANANKRTLMDKIWDYVVDKMTTAVIAKLGTTNKTLIGAVNELNSNKLQYIVIDLGTISLGESGYYRINDNEKYPIYTKIVEISYYSLITPISAINIYRGENGGTYVFGSPNTEIRDLQIRCWYW
ncbi:hypothetical protein LIP72_09095 [Mediterraneibacter faecis]|uniref:hypothetical protein n=1 Tax=Mediterraneibacter faecis TaxID=592978 RepID=UPI001D00CC3F|nr:hypothetical protein [Mediterraneibacter faecis]MCB5569508.1 hypothetical protein [Mediterraneibacter faecis]MCB5574316.1 hypothetical protein [Mediterraneibacter faecis]